MSKDDEFAKPEDAPWLKGKKKGVLLDASEKLAKRWAKVYVDLYVKKGRDAAVMWAKAFLPLERQRQLLKVEAEKLMKRRGIYRQPTPPEAS